MAQIKVDECDNPACESFARRAEGMAGPLRWYRFVPPLVIDPIVVKLALNQAKLVCSPESAIAVTFSCLDIATEVSQDFFDSLSGDDDGLGDEEAPPDRIGAQ